MKINNKGFAVSTFMYMILILGVILILATLSILSSRKMILDKQKNIAMDKSLQSRKKICKAVGGVKSVNLGTLYECQVNETDIFNFYVLSVEENNINLIMDRNICEDGTAQNINGGSTCKYQWYSSETNSKGPITAMTVLYNATKNWTNIPDINFLGIRVYEDEGNTGTYGYGKIGIGDNGIYITEKNQQINTSSEATIPYDNNKKLKARLPKYGEIIGENDECAYPETCPIWLLGNLNNDGYWTLSSHSLSGNYACILDNISGVVASALINSENGIRPVITVSKSNLYD